MELKKRAENVVEDVFFLSKNVTLVGPYLSHTRYEPSLIHDAMLGR